MLKTVELIVDFRRNPPALPPLTIMNSTEVGQSHRLHCEKGPAEAVLPSPAEEVQPATGTADTVLFCHH